MNNQELKKLIGDLIKISNETRMSGEDSAPILKAIEMLEKAYCEKTNYAQLIFQITEYDGSRRTIYQRVEFIKSSRRLKASLLMSRKFAKEFLPEFFQKETSSRIRLLSITDASQFADDTETFWDVDSIIEKLETES